MLRTSTDGTCGPDFDNIDADELREHETAVLYAYRDEAVLRLLYENEGWGITRIAERYDVDPATISRHLRDNDIETRPAAHERHESDDSYGEGR